LLKPVEGATAHEQDVGGVDLQEFLLRVLASALRRYRRHGAFDDLKQRLLHALAGDVAGDRGVVRLAADLVDLVDIDDAALRALDVVVGGLQQLEDDVLDVLADVAGLGQRGRVGHGERHVEDARQGLRQQRLAGAGWANQQDVRLRELDFVVLGLVLEPLVVIVNGDREHLLGVVLADHVVVEDLANLLRGRNAVARLHQRGLLLADDVHAQLDALVADKHGRAGNELAHFVLALAAERAVERVLGVAVADLAHFRTPTRCQSSQSLPHRPKISPSRESSSTEPISRRYMRTGSSVRSVGSLASALAGTFCWTSTSSPPSRSASSVSMTLTAISLNMARTSSICSELTSSDGRTELISSRVT